MGEQEFDNTNKGALWKKEMKDGKGSYLNGSINVDGKTYWLSVFKNSYKTTDTQPDYNVSITPQEETKASAPAKKIDTETDF